MSAHGLAIKVTVTDRHGHLVRQYVMDHDDQVQRRVLGEQCRNAFEAGQAVSTTPLGGA